METLKKNNWWVWLILTILTFGISNIFLAHQLGCIKKNAWYTKPSNWALGIIFLFIPFVIMIAVFLIQMTISAAEKLEVSGPVIYTSPYIWIICMIIPFVGWIIFITMYIYLLIWILLRLKNGYGEKI